MSQKLVRAFFLILMAAAPMLAQGTRGTIRGKVTDPNGAVVAGAKVKLTNIGKQVDVSNVQTNAEGVYQFLEVEPATYSITISAGGFADKQIAEVKVEPNRNVQFDISLSVAGTTAEVTISTATQELVDRESPTLGATVDPRRVVGLPLNGRNVLQLALLQPGVIETGTTATETFGGGLGFRVNGNRGVENNLTLDGANNNEVAVGGSTGFQLRPDAVQEFRLLTSNFEAEFGRNTGAVINVVTKSGTNDFHGNARIFYRPTFLSAARYFDQDSPTDPARRGPGDFRRPFERKEIGGQIGGPISFPKKVFGPLGFSGRNRAFFFADFETRRQLVGASRTITGIPSAAERGGDFSQLGVTLIDPATGRPFPGNRIPANRISPIAQYYNGFLPVPDASGTATAGANETRNYNQFTSRLDFQATEKQTFGFTYNFYDNSTLSPFAFGGPPDGSSVPGFGSLDLRTTNNYVVRHTYAISPAIVNSLLLGYARNLQPSFAPNNTTTPAQIGFTGNFVLDPQFAGPPMIFLYDRNFQIGNTYQGPQERVAENFQIQDALSWAKGDHRFKFGFDGTQYRQDQAFLFINQGAIGFTATVGGNTTGDDYADFLIGNSPSDFQIGSNGLRDFRQKSVAFFGQDAWRVSDGLTLSLGLRWEYVSPITDKFNRVAYYRPGSTSRLLTSGQLRDFAGRPITIPASGRAPNGVVYVGDPDPALGGTVPEGGVRKDWNNYAPRVGIAWTPSSSGGFLSRLLGEPQKRQTVIRAGFGLYYGALIADTALQQQTAPGFSGTDAYFDLGTGTLANPFAPDPFPNYVADPSQPTNQGQIPFNPLTQSSLIVTAPLANFSQPIDPFIRTPYTYQYNLTVERGFLTDYVLSLSYVGNRGYKQYAREQINAAYGTFIAFPAGRTRITPTTSGANTNARRANTDIQTDIVQLVSAARSWYDAFEVNLQRRHSKGLLFQVAYTFSKSISETDTQRGQLDLLDRRFGRSLSSNDAPHRLVASFLYDLPFARKFGGFANRLFDGWSVGGIATFQSGLPFTVTNPFNTTGTGVGVRSFADLGAPFQPMNPRENNSRAFNVDAFRAFGDPTQGFVLARDFRRGTSRPNQFRLNNGINNWDLILSKNTRLWSELSRLELRFEMFNAFNHTQFLDADLNLGTTRPNPSFGRFISARESRVIQLGARVSF
ncbi:MAG: carboxypeptidase regulatory-like domain-containing protein [Blastocatellia bacterium]